MKVVFLDIDGVLNSFKSALLHGNLFLTTKEVAKKLDPYGSLFLKRLTQHGVQVVLSSTWRMGVDFHTHAGKSFDFPILDRTCIHPFKGSVRGNEIQIWLEGNPSVTHYCIIDDDSDMLEEQLPHFVKTDRKEGLTFKNMEQVCKILGFDVWDLTAHRRDSQ